MTEDIDIWRTASVLIKTHGEAAMRVAAKRMDALLDDHDLDGFRVWKRIFNAIDELQRMTPITDKPFC